MFKTKWLHSSIGIMSTLPNDVDSPVSVVRDVIVEFMNMMLSERAEIEQRIREKAEEIRTQFAQLGQSTYSYADVDRLSQAYKETFVQFYRNTIHTRLVTYATRTIKEGIERGYVNLDIVREEVFNEFRELQEIANVKGELDMRSEEMEKTLLQQTESFSDVQSENIRLQNELQMLRQTMEEKMVEYQNTAASMSQMENQINLLGQQLMETNAELDDTRDLYARKEAEVLKLQSELSYKGDLESELENLRAQVKELTRRESELLASQSATSSEFMDQLQQELEKTREELYTLKTERVEKNEELRRTKLELDETRLKLDHLEGYKEKTDSEIQELKAQVQNLTEERNQLSARHDQNLEKISEKDSNIEELTLKIASLESKLEEASEQLKTYEGKITLSGEVKEGYEKSINYFKKILTYDPKFRALTILDSIDGEVPLDAMSQSLGLPSEIVHRSLVELADAGYITIRRDGTLVFARTIDNARSPFSLKEIFSEAI